MQALFGIKEDGKPNPGAWLAPQVSWGLEELLGKTKCIGSESCAEATPGECDPVGILGYLNLPLEGVDLPYQIWVFAEDSKPITSVLKVTFSNTKFVQEFRAFKERLGLWWDRDDQWNSDISLYGTRPFACSWPNNYAGCTSAALPRGFLKMTIPKIMISRVMNKILRREKRGRGSEDGFLFNFDLIDTQITWARSPPGDSWADDTWECVQPSIRTILSTFCELMKPSPSPIRCRVDLKTLILKDLHAKIAHEHALCVHRYWLS